MNRRRSLKFYGLGKLYEYFSFWNGEILTDVRPSFKKHLRYGKDRLNMVVRFHMAYKPCSYWETVFQTHNSIWINSMENTRHRSPHSPRLKENSEEKIMKRGKKIWKFFEISDCLYVQLVKASFDAVLLGSLILN